LIIYRVRLDVPRGLVLLVSRLLARDRKEVGTRKKRALPGLLPDGAVRLGRLRVIPQHVTASPAI
jgi:hypothetical protein